MLNIIFRELGLSSNDATVYEYLLARGDSTGGDIIKNTALKRGTVYNTLKTLVRLSLIEEHEKNGIAHFRAEHPESLKSAVENRRNEINQLDASVRGLLPGLVSEYNLTYRKPGVQYFEGAEGAQAIFEDMLSTESEIISYADSIALNKYIPELNDKYMRKRERKNIKKRIITIDSKIVRSRAHKHKPGLTEIRIIPGEYHFASVMQVYDDKVSYISLDDTSIIGVIVEDKRISNMHRSIFEYMWQTAEPIQIGSNKK